MAWRMARSLDILLGQLNARYPSRSKASDGGVGDAAHSARVSDHNPDRGGVVRARDYTHDPAAGLDIDKLSDELAASLDVRIRYIICNQLIMNGAAGPRPWQWTAYRGSNPHRNHLHLSVVADSRADDARPWTLPMLGNPQQPPPGARDLHLGMSGPAVGELQLVLKTRYPRYAGDLALDSEFGAGTEAAVREFQRRSGLQADGVVGLLTRAALHL